MIKFQLFLFKYITIILLTGGLTLFGYHQFFFTSTCSAYTKYNSVKTALNPFNWGNTDNENQ